MSGQFVDQLRQDMIDQAVWNDQLVQQSGIQLIDTPFVTVGGGIGSFTVVDYLRLAGVHTSQITVLGNQDKPYATYKALANNSQIPDYERLRSDAGSVLDSPWGFPSYAFREAAATKKLGPLWTVLTEPIFSEYYTPQAAQVYQSVEREIARIGWYEMLKLGQVRMIRRRAEGGYFVVFTPKDHNARIIYRTRFVHVAVGYPGIKMLQDLQEYKVKHKDLSRVVNAYEDHSQIYSALAQRPGRVLVRGSGIVASRVLQRLLDQHESGRPIQVLHLFRNYVAGPQKTPSAGTRTGKNGFAYQAFNYPKAAWGGQLKDQLLNLHEQGRADLIRQTGGTNTAPRASWTDQLHRCQQQGSYVQLIGQVKDIHPVEGQGIRTVVEGPNGPISVDADFIIDATGLEAGVDRDRLLTDLINSGGARKNTFGRLQVTPNFEVEGAGTGVGKVYASGAMTLGGPYAPVDSFLGLQYAAQQIVDDLAANGFGQRMGPLRSMSQWFKWLRNQQP